MSLQRRALTVVRLRRTLLGLVVVASLVHAEVPPQQGVMMMLKTLTYDTGFAARGSGDFVVCVPMSEAAPVQSAAYGALEPLGSARLSGRKVRLQPVPVDKPDELSAHQASAVLLLPGLESKRVDQWVAAAQRLKVYTLSLVPSDAQDKVLLSVEVVDDRTRPVLNKRLATSMGARFPPSVLKLARIVQ